MDYQKLTICQLFKNETAIKVLTETLYDWKNFWEQDRRLMKLFVGSRGEGLSMEELADHGKPPDVDIMDVQGGGWGVHVGSECSAVNRCVVCSGSTICRYPLQSHGAHWSHALGLHEGAKCDDKNGCRVRS